MGNAQTKGEVISQYLDKADLSDVSKNSSAMLARKLDLALRDAGFESNYSADLNEINSKKITEITTIAEPKNLTQLADLLRADGIPIEVTTKVDEITGAYKESLIIELRERYQQHLNHTNSKSETYSPDILHKNNTADAAEHIDIKKSVALGIGLKAAAVHLAPPGIEATLLKLTADGIDTKAQDDLNNRRLTTSQYEIVVESNRKTLITAAGISSAPDPTGLSSDKAVQLGDQTMVEALMKAGVSKTQAEQYRMGSLIEAVNSVAHTLSDDHFNKNDIDQFKSINNDVPLSLALNLSASELIPLGKMSETLGGNALKEEVSRHPEFEKLKNLSTQELSVLSNLVNAGQDPTVKVNDAYEIMMSAQQPTLSSDPSTAFRQATNYIMQTGDTKWQLPKNIDQPTKQVIEIFEKAYEHLAADGGLSNNDFNTLLTTLGRLSEFVQSNELSQQTSNQQVQAL